MTSITIPLPDEALSMLRKRADELGISPEELARAGIEDLLSRPEDAFQQAIDYLLEKNADLYRRLA